MASSRLRAFLPFVVVAALLCSGLSWLAEKDDAAALASREAHDLAALHESQPTLPEGIPTASLPIDAHRGRRMGLGAFGFLVLFAAGHRALSKRAGPWLDVPLLAFAGAVLVRLPTELTRVVWSGSKSSPLAVHAAAHRMEGLARALAEDLAPQPGRLDVWGWRLVAGAVVVHAAWLVIAALRRRAVPVPKAAPAP